MKSFDGRILGGFHYFYAVSHTYIIAVLSDYLIKFRALALNKLFAKCSSSWYSHVSVISKMLI